MFTLGRYGMLSCHRQTSVDLLMFVLAHLSKLVKGSNQVLNAKLRI